MPWARILLSGCARCFLPSHPDLRICLEVDRQLLLRETVCSADGSSFWSGEAPGFCCAWQGTTLRAAMGANPTALFPLAGKHSKKALLCSCNDAKPNILRIAGELAAIEGHWKTEVRGAAVSEGMRVGIVDCTDAVMGELCRELGSSVRVLKAVSACAALQ